VDRGEDDGREVALHRLAALLRHAELAAEQRLRGCRAEADQHRRPHDGELRVEPRAAGRDLAPARLLVDAPLPPRRPLEVLDHVRHVGERAVDPGLLERLVEEASGRADERASLAVLAVAGLLADEHGAGAGAALAEDGLGGRAPERARLAAGRGLAERGKGGTGRDERRRRLRAHTRGYGSCRPPQTPQVTREWASG